MENEDLERIHLLDQMYLIESEKLMEEEWQKWEDQQAREAKIVVIYPKNKKEKQK